MPSSQEKRVSMPVVSRLSGAALLVGLGLLVASSQVPFGADLYDEGLIANGGALALRGQWPGINYYAPYPPAAFGALAAAFRLWGVRLIVERWFAAALAALAGALGFWLITGFAAGSRRTLRSEAGIAFLATVAITLLLGGRWVTPVNGGALVFVLAAGLGLRAALPRGRLGGAFLCGILLGAAALWRLDFGLYATVAALPVWLLFAGYATEPPQTQRQRVRGALALCLGTLVVLGPAVGWILALGGQRAANSLFWWPLTSTGAQRLPWTRHWSCFLMPLAALLLLARAFPSLKGDPGRTAVALWLVFVGFGFLAYALGRTHATHLLPLRVVCLLLVGLCVGRDTPGARRQTPDACPDGSGRAPFSTAASRRLTWTAFLTIFISTVIGPVREYVRARRFPAERRWALPRPRGMGVYPPPREARDYARIMAYLSHEVPAGGRLFCATARHDIFLKDDNLAYFLSGRDSGTYYWCFDGAVTSTLPVQTEMVRELEANRVGTVLIRTASFNHEPNASSRSSGVHRLDQYLRAHYHRATGWDDYQILRRCDPWPGSRSVLRETHPHAGRPAPAGGGASPAPGSQAVHSLGPAL